ncbi:MAG: peptide chain release factor N(5)-glutamine methyltransferase [Proteobacteria bacterium]|nr:peptide chain release factor N(5)-glutamine methyltransferase [Pseudomonadota bacterium]
MPWAPITPPSCSSKNWRCDVTDAAAAAGLEAWTIGRILTWSVDFLRGKGLVDSPRLDAELLLSHALKLARIQLYMQFDKPLSAAEREPFKGFLQRRGRGEPVAYITGEKEFMGYRFEVSPAVLIPRPDTEVLVEQILDWAKAKTKIKAESLGAALDTDAAEAEGAVEVVDAAAAPSWHILDVGTGSGCVASSLALKLAAAQVQVSAWDVDASALANATANAARLGASVAFSQCDALEEASWDGDEAYDIIVSNPPYISPEEATDLSRSVAGYEPQQALFAPPDGLRFYRALAVLAPRRLKAGGRLAVEIGATQAKAVQQILAEAGWQDISLRQDWSRLDRVVSAVWLP